MAAPQWTVNTGVELATIEERTNVTLDLPLQDTAGVTVSKIAGSLPTGLRIEGTSIKGVAVEVGKTTDFEFVLRASNTDGIADRTFTIQVIGEDAPIWLTPEGDLALSESLRNKFWVDTLNTDWGVYENFSNVWTNQTVDIYKGIPSREEGADGDYAFVTDLQQFWHRINGRWWRMTKTQMEAANGIGTDFLVQPTTPALVETNYWLNTNSATNGLNLLLKEYDETVPVWRPKEYTVSKTAPIAAFDKQIWVQTYDDTYDFVIKIYNDRENNWDVLDVQYSNTPPDSVNKAYFVLDSTIVDFQLQAIDTDLTAGDNLYFYIADEDGELPPGLTLSPDGRISGIVDPLLSLDIDAIPGYDIENYDDDPLDFNVVDADGFDSYFYDTTFYGYSTPTQRPKKLNRYYNFRVTVADDVSESKRDFRIYVVGDDFLRADNTIMKAGTGIFTADSTYLRKPVWLTPGNLGVKRAGNYVTVYLDIFDPNFLLGTISYNIQPFNDDNTPSQLPPGLELDGLTGELAGVVPYQPTISKDYKFTVEALRQENDSNDVVEISAGVIEDTLSGKSSVKIAKLPTGTLDGVNDLDALLQQDISIDNNLYTVESVSDVNEDFDLLNLNRPLEPTYKGSPITIFRNADIGDDFIYINSTTESNKDFYKNKVINYSATEAYTLLHGGDSKWQDYIEYTIQPDDSAGDLQFNYDDAGINPVPGETALDAFVRYLAVLGFRTADYNIYTFADRYINFEITSNATSRIRNNFVKVFSAEDSSTVNVTRSDEYIKIPLDVSLQRNIVKNTQLSFGVTAGTVITKRIDVSNNEVVSTIKTFTLTVLGDFDNKIDWITPSDLGTLVANRISYLKLEATTNLEGDNLRFDIISGKLPNGLELKRDGEIVGVPRQYTNSQGLGLTDIDDGQKDWTSGLDYEIGNVVSYNSAKYICIQAHTSNISIAPSAESVYWNTFAVKTTFDGGTTSFDREYKFKVLARDKFGYAQNVREFKISVNDIDNTVYTNMFMQPFLKQSQRSLYDDFINNFNIFTPEYIYRPYDNNFGVQKDLRSLAYAGIENKSIASFVAAATKNHKRKNFAFGELKTAIAKVPGSNDVLYEVVYVELKDFQQPSKGNVAEEVRAKRANPILINDVKYEVQDDFSAITAGLDVFTITPREGNVIRFSADQGAFEITTRDNGVVLSPAIGEIQIRLRSGLNVVFLSISSTTADSGDPWRFRPQQNAISVDNNAIKVSQTQNVRRFISSIGNMRKRISEIGLNERQFLPLWMRSSQETTAQELDFVLALPLCYCKPGTSELVKENIINNGFDFKQIDYEIDRYIVQTTENNDQEQFVLFGNYKFNV